MFFKIDEQKKELNLKLYILGGLILLLLALGTLVYHLTEGWSIIDSLYFSAISLATRGYSDMHPTTWFSVIFSIFYLLIGVGIIIYSVSTLVAYYTTFYEQKLSEAFKGMRKKKEIDKWIEIRQKKK